MSVITAASLPTSVELAGSPTPIHSGFRRHVELELLDRTDPSDIIVALGLCYGSRTPSGVTALPAPVLDDPAGAADAAFSWHDAAYGLMDYGSAGRGGGGEPARIFDWEADAAIVASDFLATYGIDLTDQRTQLHWYRFMALFLPLCRSGGLVSQAVHARSPLIGRTTKAERERHAELARAWALPPTESELRARALSKF